MTIVTIGGGTRSVRKRMSIVAAVTSLFLSGGALSLPFCGPSVCMEGDRAHAAAFEADPRAELHVLELTNEERKSEGLRPLRVDERLVSIARRHAADMARRGRVYHNEWLHTRDGRRAMGNPSAFGENVGSGGSGPAVHYGFMQSPPHRANILRSSFRDVGIGVVRHDGLVWVVEVFVTPRRAGASPAGGSSGGPSGGPAGSGSESGSPGADPPQGSAATPPANSPSPLSSPSETTDPLADTPAGIPPPAATGSGSGAAGPPGGPTEFPSAAARAAPPPAATASATPGSGEPALVTTWALLAGALLLLTGAALIPGRRRVTRD